MGLPANTTTTNPSASASASASAPNAADPMSRPIPSTTTDLPPEALDLAAKLFDLARAGDTAALTPYLTAGLPPNLTNHSGDTLLMLAAYHGHADTVRALIGKGADVNAVNARGQSPLAGAVFKGHEGVVRALVEGGADADVGVPNAKDTAVMFKKEEWFGLLGVEEGRSVPGMVPDGRPGGS